MVRIRTALVASVLAATAVIGSAGAAAADPQPPTGVAKDSPGVVSGNVIQIPVDIPVNVCGDTIDIIGLLNPSSNNTCHSS
ncbi:chaplin [Streptomyces sp. NPDC001691]|uniref:chaplin n=1 Tax=Streptomyces sp. NPDC001691 TaxID=3364600 RepID=UPI0036C12A83